MNFPDPLEMQAARMRRDATYDGVFWVGVRTMKIYCRPSCPARRPLEKNVDYFAATAVARDAGFRACKRCAPDETDGRAPRWIEPLLALAEARGARAHGADAYGAGRITDAEIRSLGIDPARVRRFFLKQHGVTFQAWHRAARLGKAEGALASGARVLEAGLDAGYESASAFHEAYRKTFGTTPGRGIEEGSTSMRVPRAVVDPSPRAESGRAIRYVLTRSIASPIGRLDLAATERGICLLEFAERRALPTEIRDIETHFGCAVVPGTNPHLEQMIGELHEYFEGRLRRFETPLDVFGTAFQETVWRALREIPYGETVSYGRLAERIGRPGAQRAVGHANGGNRIAIAIPCHRVVEANGRLRGYGGGLWRKQHLLDLEAGVLPLLQAADIQASRRINAFP